MQRSNFGGFRHACLSASSRVAVPSAIRISSADTSFGAMLFERNTVYSVKKGRQLRKIISNFIGIDERSHAKL